LTRVPAGGQPVSRRQTASLMASRMIHLPISSPCRIGVVADTHGWLHPGVFDALRGAALVVHAGDIGAPSILERLRSIAPVQAVRGNADSGEWADSLPEQVVLEAGTLRILVVHEVERAQLDRPDTHYAAVITGHSHVAEQQTLHGTLFFNPGTAGRARLGRPLSVGLLDVRGERIESEIVLLEV
jgi:uncharacterized protein